VSQEVKAEGKRQSQGRGRQAVCFGREVGAVAKFPSSKSEEDWYLVNEWLRQGVDKFECIARLENRRCLEKRNVKYYARYTVEKAIRLSR
jgi:hypothetical protein